MTQVQELLAMLSIGKSQLAKSMGVSLQELSHTIEASEVRFNTLLSILKDAGVSVDKPLNPRFVRKPLVEGGTMLIEILFRDLLDVTLSTYLISEAHRLSEEVRDSRQKRESKLDKAGFDKPSPFQRKKQLSINMALRDWPKT